MIAIVNYGSGNSGAIANIYKLLKVPHILSADISELAKADRYIIPGVGAFDATLDHLTKSGLASFLAEQVQVLNKKVLGICVGMQIMGDASDEGSRPGLGWIPGHIRRIDSSLIPTPLKTPHMGWNSIDYRSDSKLFAGIDAGRGFYFLHNYYFEAREAEHIVATVEYGKRFPCAVGHGSIFGLQFHPEKSHSNGMAIFKNFAEL